MKPFCLFLIILTQLVPLSILDASEEEFLEWRTAIIQLADSEKAGKVSCEITTSEAGYSRFVIHAFNKEYTLQKEDLAKLKAFPLSSLSTRHEAGYEQLGGYTIHFRFKRIWYDKESKKVASEVIYVSVIKDNFRLSEPRQLDEKEK